MADRSRGSIRNPSGYPVPHQASGKATEGGTFGIPDGDSEILAAGNIRNVSHFEVRGTFGGRQGSREDAEEILVAENAERSTGNGRKVHSMLPVSEGNLAATIGTYSANRPILHGRGGCSGPVQDDS